MLGLCASSMGLMPTQRLPVAGSHAVARSPGPCMAGAAALAKNERLIEEYRSSMEDAALMFCVRSEGIPVNEMSALRQSFPEDIKIKVCKNNLLQLASEKESVSERFGAIAGARTGGKHVSGRVAGGTCGSAGFGGALARGCGRERSPEQRSPRTVSLAPVSRRALPFAAGDEKEINRLSNMWFFVPEDQMRASVRPHASPLPRSLAPPGSAAIASRFRWSGGGGRGLRAAAS